MWRWLLICAVLAFAAPARAAPSPPLGDWDICSGALGVSGPILSDCRPLTGIIDPQGREIWLRARLRPRAPGETDPVALYISGAASSEFWLDRVHVGANGAPARTAQAERPGRYDKAFPQFDALWTARGGQLVARLSAFHVGMRFDHPVGAIWVERFPFYPGMRSLLLAVSFAAAGALLAAVFGFGAVFAMRRTGSSLMLAAMAGVAALQAGVENYRHLVHYDYPFHVWRVNAIWGLSAAFAFLIVAFASARFVPRERRYLLGLAVIALPATYLLKGFDVKSSAALLIGVGLAGLAAALGVWRRTPGARSVLAYLLAFLAAAAAAPSWLLDLSFFVLAASLTLPLLVAEVIRLGREDRDREAALTRAASRPDRLTVATPRGVELTPLKDIVAILGADDYAELRLVGGRALLHAARLERLESQLPPSFIRIHRSAIANLAHAERLERDGTRWRLHMSEGPVLAVSRSRLPAVRDALDPPALPLRATA